MAKETLSASKIKVLKSCSWQYWCKYHLKLPDKTNSGALKGDVVHLILECLGDKKHIDNYNSIIQNQDPFSSPGVKRLILKQVKKKNLQQEDALEICSMVLNGLFYDFFGKKFGEPTEVISEKDFEITVEEDSLSYKVKGFIDKLFIYGNDGIVLIRDFKTNKKKFEGKEVTDNLQDYIYTLAIKKMYPQYNDIKMEFVFLKDDLQENNIIEMQAKSNFELKGFEIELAEYQKYADGFNEKTAVSNLAAQQGVPKDGSFSGFLLCGRASKPNEKKKDGSPKWYCTYKFPFDYYCVLDENKNIKKTYFTRKEINEKTLLPKETIEKRRYEGCPFFNKKQKNDDDGFQDFDLTSQEKDLFSL